MIEARIVAADLPLAPRASRVEYERDSADVAMPGSLPRRHWLQARQQIEDFPESTARTGGLPPAPAHANRLQSSNGVPV